MNLEISNCAAHQCKGTDGDENTLKKLKGKYGEQKD